MLNKQQLTDVITGLVLGVIVLVVIAIAAWILTPAPTKPIIIKNDTKIESLTDSIKSNKTRQTTVAAQVDRLDSIIQTLDLRIANMKQLHNHYAIYNITTTYADSSDAAVKGRILELADSLGLYPVN